MTTVADGYCRHLAEARNIVVLYEDEGEVYLGLTHRT